MKARIPVLFSLLVAIAPAAQGAGSATSTGIPVRSDGSSITADVADKVSPAVVFIRTERTVDARSGDGDTPFEFFREFFPQQPQGDDPRTQRNRKMPGGGSGFVFDDQNRILTN